MYEPQVMIVEDEKPLLNLYKYLLEKQGYNVIAAADGQEALNLLLEHTPQLIFLDVRLPYVSGLQVLLYIRTQERFRHTRVVVNSSQKDYEHAPHVNEFVLKPLRPQTISDIAIETFSALSHSSS